MNDAKLTVRLPPGDLEFAKRYARDHGVSLSALVRRFFARLQETESNGIPPGVRRIAGVVPSDVDVRDEYVAGMRAKHE